MRPRIRPWRSIAKAVSWRAIGTIDTLILSYLLITYLGPYLGAAVAEDEAIKAASLIAITEVATKFVLYFLHERAWSLSDWGVTFDNQKRREKMCRSTLKTGLWRLIASLDTFLLAWFFTGSMATAVSIGGLEIFTKLALYYVHERVWSRLSFGIVPGRKAPALQH